MNIIDRKPPEETTILVKHPEGTCVACGHTRFRTVRKGVLHRCRRCGQLHGYCHRR